MNLNRSDYMNKKIGFSIILIIYVVIGIGLFYQPVQYVTDSSQNVYYEILADNSGNMSDLESIIVIGLAAFVIILYIVFGIRDLIRKMTKKVEKKSDNHKKSYGVSTPEIQKFFPEITEEQLSSILFQKFIDTQVAWMNFDYKTLKRLLSSELYSSYKADLDELKVNHSQNIISDIKCVERDIISIAEEAGIVIITIYIHTSSYDYVIDTNTKEIINGSSTNIVHNRYHLHFIIKRGETLTECPSCGAKIEAGSSECDYCHTILINNYGGFVLSSKKNVY